MMASQTAPSRTAEQLRRSAQAHNVPGDASRSTPRSHQGALSRVLGMWWHLHLQVLCGAGRVSHCWLVSGLKPLDGTITG